MVISNSFFGLGKENKFSFRIQISPKLCEIRIIKSTCKFDEESLIRASNPHINDMIFQEEDRMGDDELLFDNLDYLENSAN